MENKKNLKFRYTPIYVESMEEIEVLRNKINFERVPWPKCQGYMDEYIESDIELSEDERKMYWFYDDDVYLCDCLYVSESWIKVCKEYDKYLYSNIV